MKTPKLKRYVQRVGCKQSIVFDILGQIINITPNSQELAFVDLFGGGGVVSANATYFFKNVIYNEIDKGVHDLFVAVQNTEFVKKLKQKRVSREDFFNLNPEVIEDNLLLTVRSFGNNRSSYLYGKQIERRKYLTHHIVFCKTEEEYKTLIKQYNDEKVATFNKYGGLRTCYLKDDDRDVFSNNKNRRAYKFGNNADYIREFIQEFDLALLKKERGDMINNNDVNLIKNVEAVSQRLESLERLELNNLDYRDVKLPAPDSCIIYLDPPYRNTYGYEVKFNFDEFDKYVLELKEKGYKIFVSEYNLPYGEIIRSKTKRGMLSQKKENMTGKENLYFI